jgi:hypothetical protein
MKKFGTGFAAGVLTTAGIVAGLAFGVKKTVIEPLEEKEAKISENRKKAMRKRIAR